MAHDVEVSQGKLVTRKDGSILPATVLGQSGATPITGSAITAIAVITKAAYTALSPAVATVLYITSDTGGLFYGATTIVAGS